MVKLTLAVSASLLASANAFAPSCTSRSMTALSSSTAEDIPSATPPVTKPKEAEYWDPMSLSKLGMGKSFDTFPNMFPHMQFLTEAEIKHGRMSMLAWTGIWATHEGGMGMGMHIPGMPIEPDWTKALGTFAADQPALFGGILMFIAFAEGESVGHAGDNFRGKSTKTPGDFGFDLLGLKSKLSEEKAQRYTTSELTNGRAAMIAMASMFAFESIPGSVPLMDLFGAQ